MTIKIEAGKYYMTRDGQKVGPMELSKYGEYLSTHPWVSGSGMTYMDNGKYDPIGSKDGADDIIAEWTDEAPLPYGHVRLASGAVVDLTAITVPFGLLDAETQDALKKHDGPYEAYQHPGWELAYPTWLGYMVYRVKSQPPAPVVGEMVMTGWIACRGPTFSYREMENDTHRMTIQTRDGQLVTGTYTGPDGLTIKVDAL